MSLITNDYLTAEEFAASQNVDIKTVYAWINRGIAPPHAKEYGMYWFDKQAAAAFQKPKRGRRK